MSAASGDSEFVDAVAEAAGALRSLFAETPLQENDYLSKKTGARVFLKREDLTPVRSYKIRGAFNFFRKAMAQGGTGRTFVCASAAIMLRDLPMSAVILAAGVSFSCR